MNGTLADSVDRLLASGAELTLEALGGYDVIVKCPLEVARCRFAPEIAHLVFQHGLANDQQSLDFVADLVACTAHDITFAGVIDSLIRNDQLPATLADRCFEHTLEHIRNRSAVLLVRTSALRGALGLVRGTARRRASLKAALLWVDESDDDDFLLHVARIAGLLVTQQPDDDLIALLSQLLKIDSARGEAAFELGMCHLGVALSQERPLRIYEELKAAKGKFATAIQLRELRPDATLLHEVVDLLCCCHDLKLPTDIAARVAVISSAVISYQAYINTGKEVLGIEPRHLEMTCWSSLALRLAQWIKSSTQPAWYDAARIIEEELLPLYDASRSVLRRTSTGGLEVMIRPHIVGAVRDNRSQLYLLRHWLEIHGLAELGQNAADIITAVERALVGDGTPSHPDAAGAVAATAPAILDAAPITSIQRQKILTQVLAGTLAIAVQQASPKIEECLEQVRSAFASIPDYTANSHASRLFDSLILQIMRFLQCRLDATSGGDPTVEYLFRNDPHDLPIEKDLQQDFIRFLQMSGLGEIHEVDGIGGGRSDVVLVCNGVRIVSELKRELADSSWEALLANYGQQTVTYQTTNVRLGVLLVLDLVDRGGTTPHIDTLWHCATPDAVHDGPRGIFVARVPGRRVKPSQLNR